MYPRATSRAITSMPANGLTSCCVSALRSEKKLSIAVNASSPAVPNKPRPKVWENGDSAPS